MKKIFICSPYRGDVEKNTRIAKRAARFVLFQHDIPIIPHLYFPQFLHEDNEPERIEGIKMGVELMKDCEQIWIIGTNITAGMEYELRTAKETKIPVVLFDEGMSRIDTDTMILDERLDERYRNIVKDLTFFRY